MSPISNAEVLFFDVFGTVFDWYTTVSETVAAIGRKYHLPDDFCDCGLFTQTWRKGYFEAIRLSNSGGGGTLNTDEMMREILEKMIASGEWSQLSPVLTEADKNDLCEAWHHLKAWPDVSTSMYVLKKKVMVVALSNGNVRLLADLAKHSDVPWDVILSTELFGAFKPKPEVYLGGMKHLSVRPENCVMVACHLWDLEAAASHGMKTIYIRRDAREPRDEPDVRPKSQGGQVDLVIDSFAEIAAALGETTK